MLTIVIKEIKLAILSGLLLSVISCKKFVELPVPSTEVSSEIIFEDSAKAVATISGIYQRMFSNVGTYCSGSSSSITYLLGIYSDEMRNYSADPNNQQFYDVSLNPRNTTIDRIWTETYQLIYSANAIIEGLAQSKSLSVALKQQITGEGKFLRAFFHLYLTNIFGKIPVVLTPDYSTNSRVSRSSVNDVYAQIISDLQSAESLLPQDYSVSGGERTRVNKNAAIALLSRVYLYNEQWVEAETKASELINNPELQLETDVNGVFLKESKEAIWQLRTIFPANGINTFDAQNFITTGNPALASLADGFYESFNNNDNRKSGWINSTTNDNGETVYYPYKYKVRSAGVPPPISEYGVILRLAEQYLIRAEARLQLNNLIEAEDDINIIRNRSGIGDTDASLKEELMEEIEWQRKFEFFAEWGHRFIDLKRWPGIVNSALTRADDVLSVSKSSNWQSTDVNWPIPQLDRDKNSNLTQNDGY